MYEKLTSQFITITWIIEGKRRHVNLNSAFQFLNDGMILAFMDLVLTCTNIIEEVKKHK